MVCYAVLKKRPNVNFQFKVLTTRDLLSSTPQTKIRKSIGKIRCRTGGGKEHWAVNHTRNES